MQRLSYRFHAEHERPKGDIVFFDRLGRCAEPFDDDVPVDRIRRELEADKVVYVKDPAGRFPTFMVIKPHAAFVVTTTESPPRRLGTFSSVDAALWHGMTCRSPNPLTAA